MILASLVLLAAIHTPEECFVGTLASSPAGPAASRRRGSEDASGPAGGTPAFHSVEHNGKTYTFRFADCREEFLTDPERYSQLYDALAELHAGGVKIENAPPSLVPS